MRHKYGLIPSKQVSAASLLGQPAHLASLVFLESVVVQQARQARQASMPEWYCGILSAPSVRVRIGRTASAPVRSHA